MSVIQTKFSAPKNGFSFINSFELRLPVQYQIPLLGKIELSDVIFGLCGGMCFASLDYFYAGEHQPAYEKPDEIDSKLYTFLCARQLDSLRVSVLIKLFEWMMLEDNELVKRMVKTELPRLKKSLDKGEPVVLALIYVRGFGNPTQNHQVLAVGYEEDPATKELTIHLYDPNIPRGEPTLKLNPNKRGPAFKVAHSLGDPARGFFLIPYTREKSLPKIMQRPGTLSGEEAAAETSFRLQWPVDSHRVNQHFGENPENYRPFKLPGHEGLDLYAPSGANVYAAASGEVYEVGHPEGHPYGLLVRIKTEVEGKVYKVVYAHLDKTFVKVGQRVQAGETIGQADSTGNSFGSHLHLTLKIDGANTKGYPPGIVDPWPFLKDSVAPDPKPLPPPSGVKVYTTTDVNLRQQPSQSARVLATLPSGEGLDTLGEAPAIRPKIGKQEEWLLVKTAAQAGYVAAWLVSTANSAFPPSDLVIYPNDTATLRAGPGTNFPSLASLTMTDALTVLGNEEVAESRLGKTGEWIQVQTPKGERGFVAAWLVHKTGKAPAPNGMSVYPTDSLSVRARPTTEANVLTVVMAGEPLTVLGDKLQALGKIGQEGEWLNVRTLGKHTGYVAAWYVTANKPAEPPPAAPAGLIVTPSAGINLRAQPSLNSPRVSGAVAGTELTVIEPDLKAARLKVGKQDQWIYVQTPNRNRGWVAAWYVTLK